MHDVYGMARCVTVCVHGVYMANSACMTCAWYVHGLRMACAWHAHGVCMACAWRRLHGRRACCEQAGHLRLRLASRSSMHSRQKVWPHLLMMAFFSFSWQSVHLTRRR